MSQDPVLSNVDAVNLGWQLFESSPDCVKLLSQDGRLLAINKAGQHAIGIEDFATVEGAPWTSIWPTATHGAEDDRVRSSEAGFDHHLTKPVQLGDVKRILAEVGQGSED